MNRHKKVKNGEFPFNFIWETPLKMNHTKKKVYQKWISPSILKKISLQIYSEKKIVPELGLKNKQLRRWSWEPFLKKVGKVVWFWKSMGQLPNLTKI